MQFSHFTRKTPEYRLSGNKKALNSVSSGLKILEHRNTIDAALLSFLGMDKHNITGVQSIFDIQLRGIFLVNILEH